MGRLRRGGTQEGTDEEQMGEKAEEQGSLADWCVISVWFSPVWLSSPGVGQRFQMVIWLILDVAGKAGVAGRPGGAGGGGGGCYWTHEP